MKDLLFFNFVVFPFVIIITIILLPFIMVFDILEVIFKKKKRSYLEHNGKKY